MPNVYLWHSDIISTTTETSLYTFAKKERIEPHVLLLKVYNVSVLVYLKPKQMNV